MGTTRELSEFRKPEQRSLRDCCHHCDKLGHWKVECEVGILCFVCRQPSHRAKACPVQARDRVKLPQMTMASEGASGLPSKAGYGMGGEAMSGMGGEAMNVRVSLSRETLSELVVGKQLLLFFHLDDDKAKVDSGARKTYADIVSNGSAESFEFLVLVVSISDVRGNNQWWP